MQTAKIYQIASADRGLLYLLVYTFLFIHRKCVLISVPHFCSSSEFPHSMLKPLDAECFHAFMSTYDFFLKNC